MSIETINQAKPFAQRHRRFRRRGSEDGAIAIMTPFVLIIMIAMFGMALDLSRSYNRKAELQIAADTAALAAAAALDGTPEGIDRASTAAESFANSVNFAYTDIVTWDPAALKFATSADAAPDDWMDAAKAKDNASKIFFAQVDTSALDASHGQVHNYFIPVVSSALAESNVAASAVAGRDPLNVLPLAICANSKTPAAPLMSASPLSQAELVEYGFRRGVSYNLMNLNPGGTSPENFLVNPIAPPGTVGTTMKNRMDVVGPFVCTGKMAIPSLRGGDVTVEHGFPINPLYVQLNSRFGPVAPCPSVTAPADPVGTSFDLAHVPWMKYLPDNLSANPLPPPNPLKTVAEQPSGATKSAYGPLWTYAKAVPYSAYTAKGGVEPPKGYSTFSVTGWSSLYNPGQPQAQSSYGDTPYLAAGGGAYKLGRDTRVLHVPLLSCPVAADATTATVLGIGKFFMTVPATSTALYAEFAGMDTEAALGGNARLYK